MTKSEQEAITEGSIWQKQVGGHFTNRRIRIVRKSVDCIYVVDIDSTGKDLSRTAWGIEAPLFPANGSTARWVCVRKCPKTP
jgi:hypothetical protein